MFRQKTIARPIMRAGTVSRYTAQLVTATVEPAVAGAVASGPSCAQMPVVVGVDAGGGADRP